MWLDHAKVLDFVNLVAMPFHHPCHANSQEKHNASIIPSMCENAEIIFTHKAHMEGNYIKNLYVGLAICFPQCFPIVDSAGVHDKGHDIMIYSQRVSNYL